jgi:hypothetical protein
MEKELLHNKKNILFKKYYFFRDGGGTPCGFKWWLRWNIAFWHLRKWLEYEGMPKNIKKLKEVLEYNKKISK